MPKDLTGLLSPKSIAVIGASRSPDKVGAIILRNILTSKFPGQVYPVNPHAETINDLKCYPDVASLPEVVDLAIIALPASLVSDSLNQIGVKGIKNVVVITAGFREIGPEGDQLDQQLVAIAAKYSLNLLGPNCLGFVNNAVPLNATFGQSETLPGNLRFISQSGAIAASLFDWCQSVNLGFSQFITLGNKSVLTENDFLSYFASDQRLMTNDQTGLSPVSPIGLYLESISHGPEFLQLTAAISRTDPVFIIKPGKTPAAAAAMQSHTGAIAGADDIFAAALTQAGVLRCQTLEDFFDLARAFAWESAPTGPKVAVISNAGGPAVISADAVIAAGLELAQFSEDSRTQLVQALPRSASIINPVDVLGDALAERYAAAAEIILRSNQADSLLVILTPQMMTQVATTAEVIGSLSQKYGKPIFCSFIGGQQVNAGEQILNHHHLPSFRFPERAIAAIGTMWQWRQLQLRPASAAAAGAPPPPSPKPDRITAIVTDALKTNHRSLDNLEANEIISLLGLPTPATSAVVSLEEAAAFAAQIGWPVVLKLSSPGLLHKATSGGVVTDIFTPAQLELAWDRLNHKIAELPNQARDRLRFQIQKDVTSGVEVIVGVKHDPTFGPVLLFGAGGQLAELVADANLKILPINLDQATQLVAQSKVYKLLQTHPGEPAFALDRLYDLIIKLTSAIPLIPEATDIEINPVIVTHNDVWAVDSKILIAGGAVHPVTPPKFHTASLISSTILAAKFHYLELESADPLVYQPGQYVSIKVAPNRINSYSIAGSSGDHKFYLLIDTSPGGPGSKFFENLKPGDKIAYLGPFGTFTFQPNDGAKHLLFLGTGTGCSPLRSILEGALKKPYTTTPIDFYFGLRHTTDVFWQDYFQQLASEHPNFQFTLSLSKPDESWPGPTGHITELVKQIPDAKDCSAYLCGNQAMIDEATQILLERNCPPDRIYSEKF
jgi:acetyltransferase